MPLERAGDKGRRTAGERMRAQRADPAFEAKRVAGLKKPRKPWTRAMTADQAAAYRALTRRHKTPRDEALRLLRLDALIPAGA